jgi:hypothetical protein
MERLKTAAVTAAVLAAMGGDLDELVEHSAQPWNSDRASADPLDVVPEPVRSVFARLGVRVRYESGAGAYYNRDDGADGALTLPRPSEFGTPEEFARVAFHELGHWTRHPARLARGETDTRADYDAEELVAELTSAYLMAHFGLSDDAKAHAGYLLGYTRELADGVYYANIFAKLLDQGEPVGPCQVCGGLEPLEYAKPKAREAAQWVLNHAALDKTTLQE